MTRLTPEFDQRIADWLEDDPGLAPSQVAVTVLAALPSIRQRRRGLLPGGGRILSMPTYWRLAAVAAVVAVAGLGAITFSGSDPDIGGSPSPASPTNATTPTSPVPASPSHAPLVFTSELYGYTVDVPAGWLPVATATVPWPDGGILDTSSGEWLDVFPFNPTGSDIGFVGIAAQPLQSGMSADDWMRALADRQAASSFACRGPADTWVDAVVGGVTARRIDVICNGDINGEDFTGWDYAYVAFVVDGTGYVVNGGPEGVDPLIATFRIPGASVPFTSPLYGYMLSYPMGWEVAPTSVAWVAGSDPSSDVFAAPVSQSPDFDDVWVAAQPLPEGTTPAAWLLAYAERVATSARDCKGPVDAWTDYEGAARLAARLAIDAEALAMRRLDLECQGAPGQTLNFTDVAFVLDGTGYVMSGNPTVIAQFLEEFQPGT